MTAENETTRAEAAESAETARAEAEEAALREAQTAEHAWEANGLKGWSWDPIVTGTGELGGAGILTLTKILVVPGSTLSELLLRVATKGTTLTAAECFAALYDPTGKLLGETADQHAAWEAAGEKAMALVAHEAGSLKIASGVKWVYGAALANGTTLPIFTGPAGGNTAASANVGLSTATGLRAGTIGAALTALPASIVLANVAAAAKAPIWMGVR